MTRRQRSILLADEVAGPAGAPEFPRWFWWFLLGFAAMPLVGARVTTSDAWWHVSMGRILAETRALPDFATLYFTPVRAHVPDFRWEALGDLILYVAYLVAGAIGLQALAVAAITAALILLRGIFRGAWNPWLLLVLLAVAGATHQLQLPRNALFSLALLPLLLWLFRKWELEDSPRWLWLAVPVAGLWGLLHGSYLLGLVFLAGFLLGDVIDQFRAGETRSLARPLGRAAAIVAAALALNTMGNAETANLLLNPLRGFLPTKRSHAAARYSPGPPIASASAAQTSVKDRLNQLIWPQTPGKVRSGDFDSPLNRLRYLPVMATFGLLAFAALALGLERPFRWSWALLLAGAAVLSLAYLRMVGYGAITSAAILLRQEKWPRFVEPTARRRKLAWATYWIAALALWASVATASLGRMIGYPPHEVGLGQSAVFDEAAARWILKAYPTEPAFTTIVTGSYALLHWYPAKRVFTDGFFAPHAPAVWNDYLHARETGSLRSLHERYGIEVAAVEHGRTDWTRLFLMDADWQPAAIGLGWMVYVRKGARNPGPPTLLFDWREAQALAPVSRTALAHDYYGALLALLKGGQPEAAAAFVRDHAEVYRKLRVDLAAEDRWAIPDLDRLFLPASGE